MKKSQPQTEEGSNPPQAGLALYRAALKNPDAYPEFIRLVQFRQLVEKNPDLRKQFEAIWEPVQKTNQIIALASKPIKPILKSILEEFNAQLAVIRAEVEKEYNAELKQCLDAVRQAVQKADAAWEAEFNCPRPHTPEDWMRLAVRAGLSADFVLKGDWLPGNVLPILEGYLQRLQDQQAGVCVPTQTQTEPGPPPRLSAQANRAYLQYNRSMQRGRLDGTSSDREVYDWMLVNERVGNSTPRFDTWQRYLREARQYYGTQKNTPRAGRPHGSSIVPISSIELERDEDR